MKKIILLILLVISAFETSAQMVQMVKDKNKNNQMKSQEFMQWKFTPKWYYYKWHITKNPLGLGLHKNYVKTDKRNIIQETPMMAAVAWNKSQAEEQGEKTDVVYKQELFKFADKEVDYQYILTKNNREELLKRINELLSNYSDSGGNPKHIVTITSEVTRIKSNVEIMKDSHIGNAKKREAYLGYEKELVNVLGMIIRLNNLQKTVVGK